MTYLFYDLTKLLLLLLLYVSRDLHSLYTLYASRLYSLHSAYHLLTRSTESTHSTEQYVSRPHSLHALFVTVPGPDFIIIYNSRDFVFYKIGGRRRQLLTASSPCVLAHATKLQGSCLDCLSHFSHGEDSSWP